ncbi:hypothetical protein, partial [Salmonella sp. s51228]|uniref:hypothetical protein n=1 Tax=Salmonella sp. s51228 TaxID=3159652 RepID=UPI00397EB947
MLLREDEKTNRLDESLTLFQAICNNKFFQKTEMILFLNKLDLFADKILNTDRHLRKYVSSYQGPERDPKLSGEHIKMLFLDLNTNKNKAIYPHFTTATDTKNIEIVLQIVLNAIIQ